MLTAFALTMRVLLAADGDCYFVGNTRILQLATCDISPATIAELTEDPAPATRASLQQRPAAPGTRRFGAVPRPAPRTVVLRGNEELERRLELAQQERIDAVARRLAAERQRDLAFGQRAEALQDLTAARRALAAAEARLQRAGRCDAPSRPAD